MGQPLRCDGRVVQIDLQHQTTNGYHSALLAPYRSEPQISMLKSLAKQPLRRLKRWRKSWKNHFDSPTVRFCAWLELQFLDHGFIRPFFNTPQEIAPGIYRSNHPSPRMIRRLASQGVKTIISLRGRGSNGPYLYEREACERHGITLEVVRMKSKKPPNVNRVHTFKDLVEQAEHPLLFHCKSGADRSGLAAALYLLITETGTIEEAKAQLSLRYLHIKQARTGILDRFIEMYEEFNNVEPIPFMEWVDNHYSPKELKRSFKPKGWANWLVDGLLRRE